MAIPAKVFGEAHASVERQLVDLKEITNRLERSPATKPDAVAILDIWHQLAGVEETLRALHLGAPSGIG